MDASSVKEFAEDKKMVTDSKLAQSIMNKEVLDALTSHCHVAAAMVASLPAGVKRRVRALRSLQKQFLDIEAQFYGEVHTLECKYEKLYKPLLEKRAQIVSGMYEPSDDECKNPWHDDTEAELAHSVLDAVISADQPTEPATEPTMDPNVNGIPDFWYTIFKNVSMLSEMVQEHDEPILKCLQDIKVNMCEDPAGFTLEFHFKPNDFFSNTVLTKEYTMKCKPDDDNPLDFEGQDIQSCKGCEINWKKGKNVTVKTINKTQKRKSRAADYTVIKSMQADSFFNFFAPPSMPEETDSDASEVQELLIDDFEIGHYIRKRVVPYAVLLYTGEGLEEDDYDYEESSTEESEEEELPSSRRSKKAPVRSLPTLPGPAGENKSSGVSAECKQQ